MIEYFYWNILRGNSMDIIKKNADLIKTLFFYTLMGIVIGACVGFCEAIFCKGLNFIFAFPKKFSYCL